MKNDKGKIYVEILKDKEVKEINENISRYYQFVFKDENGEIVENPGLEIEEWAEEIDPAEVNENKNVQVKYNEKGLKVEERLYDKNGALSDVKKYYYDKSDRLVKKEVYKTEKSELYLYFYAVYDYREDGKLIEYKEYSGEGNLAYITTNKYDRDGKLVEEITENVFNKSVREIKYSYNNLGLLKGKFIYHNGEDYIKIYFDYDDKGRLIKSETYNKDRELEDYERYEYDKNGNIAYEEGLVTFPDKIGMQISQEVYENSYNDKGDLLASKIKGRLIFFGAKLVSIEVGHPD